jgi:hypothetical protein
MTYAWAMGESPACDIPGGCSRRRCASAAPWRSGAGSASADSKLFRRALVTGRCTADSMAYGTPRSIRSRARTSISSRSPGPTTRAKRAVSRPIPSSSTARCTRRPRSTRRSRWTRRPASSCGNSIPRSTARAPIAASRIGAAPTTARMATRATTSGFSQRRINTCTHSTRQRDGPSRRLANTDASTCARTWAARRKRSPCGSRHLASSTKIC